MTSKKKKILIFSLKAGFGHLRSGQALLDYAKENLPEVQVTHVDASEITSSLKNAGDVYEFVAKKTPALWAMVYKLPFFFAGAKNVGAMVGGSDKKMKEYIMAKKPDAILFTNVVIVPLLMKVVKQVAPNVPTGVVVTDYHAHPYYQSADIDRYFVPSESAKKDLEAAGVPSADILVTGIPINPKFYIEQSVTELKHSYGITNSLPVVVLIASFRISPEECVALVRQLLEVQPKKNLVVICNGNTELYQLLKTSFKKHEHLVLVNWTEKMEEYLRFSDLVITKAGGLTTTECLTLGKKMIIINPIPGQEEYNADFVVKAGFGMRVKKISKIADTVPIMLEKPIPASNPMPATNPSEAIFKEMLSEAVFKDMLTMPRTKTPKKS
jgi:processive 1,2-diacylglycerol beta-glucosyltransferase